MSIYMVNYVYKNRCEGEIAKYFNNHLTTISCTKKIRNQNDTFWKQITNEFELP